jgi:farnesyl diphosphate synthase
MTNKRHSTWQQRSSQVLQQLLTGEDDLPQRLHQAMRYAVLNGGKRMRPLLVYAVGDFLQAPIEALDIPAAAVEIIHCYSLVHDDLPTMDDDDLRRGVPTCHKKFDEATAMLAGDALQAEAFLWLAKDKHSSADTKIAMLEILAHACGSRGMAGGQAIDLQMVGSNLTLDELSTMHQMKTGALIKSSILLGALAAKAEVETLKKLIVFADEIGLAFQIQDDILDVEGDTALLGKQQGADLAKDKPTYPSMLGLDAAKALVQQHYQQALAALDAFDSAADTLRELAAFIVQRNH